MTWTKYVGCYLCPGMCMFLMALVWPDISQLFFSHKIYRIVQKRRSTDFEAQKTCDLRSGRWRRSHDHLSFWENFCLPVHTWLMSSITRSAMLLKNDTDKSCVDCLVSSNMYRHKRKNILKFRPKVWLFFRQQTFPREGCPFPSKKLYSICFHLINIYLSKKKKSDSVKKFVLFISCLFLSKVEGHKKTSLLNNPQI